MKYKQKGFTLIELMVVISIISLFSSIAFASFATTRVKAQEATIKSDLKNIKSQAEIAFNNVGNYSTASSEVAPIIEGINKSGGAAAFYSASPYDHYTVSAKLNGDATKNWSFSDQSDTVIWDTEYMTFNNQPLIQWSDAKTACANAGKRLPTKEELKTLYDAGGMTPARGFDVGPYWSSAEINPSNAYFMYTFDGILYNGVKTNYFAVRCVH